MLGHYASLSSCFDWAWVQLQQVGARGLGITQTSCRNNQVTLHWRAGRCSVRQFHLQLRGRTATRDPHTRRHRVSPVDLTESDLTNPLASCILFGLTLSCSECYGTTDQNPVRVPASSAVQLYCNPKLAARAPLRSWRISIETEIRIQELTQNYPVMLYRHISMDHRLGNCQKRQE